MKTRLDGAVTFTILAPEKPLKMLSLCLCLSLGKKKKKKKPLHPPLSLSTVRNTNRVGGQDMCDSAFES